ncbi:MAG: GNAT family N-acetyltransferase [Oscillospiraceae bacterium]|nr:GNAT family N-acetyltransferase [Oscillospiraceae bacterium]
MMNFPEFMCRKENLIPDDQQNTPDIEGYYYTAADGSQMAFRTYKADRTSKEHTHDYDEYMVVTEGEYLVTIDGAEHLLRAGDELFIPKGTLQGGRVKKGTRSIHAFGGQRVSPYHTEEYTADMKDSVTAFLAAVFAENGKVFDINGRHSIYKDIGGSFELFICTFEHGEIVGTAALKRLSDSDCELKTMYVSRRCQGRKLGLSLARRIIDEAKKRGFERMYLDSMSCHTRAISLYKGLGFCETERYNDNDKADVFMVLDLKGEAK